MSPRCQGYRHVARSVTQRLSPRRVVAASSDASPRRQESHHVARGVAASPGVSSRRQSPRRVVAASPGLCHLCFSSPVAGTSCRCVIRMLSPRHRNGGSPVATSGHRRNDMSPRHWEGVRRAVCRHVAGIVWCRITCYRSPPLSPCLCFACHLCFALPPAGSVAVSSASPSRPCSGHAVPYKDASLMCIKCVSPLLHITHHVAWPTCSVMIDHRRR